MALNQYDCLADNLANGVHDFTLATFNLVILTSTYAQADTHSTYSDLTNEVTGTGYTAGGLAWNTPSVTPSTNTVSITAADEVITVNAGGFSNGQEYVLVDAAGSPTSGWPLVTHGDAGAPFGNVAGDLTIDYPANFLVITV